MARVPYKQHGRRHAPWGSDPIPGFGGGGSNAFEFLTSGGNNTNIADTATGTLNLAHIDGDTLLDLTDTDVPKIFADGVYALSLTISCEALTAGGRFFGALIGSAYMYAADWSGEESGSGVPMTLNWTGPMVADDTFEVTVISEDGAASRDFFVYSFLLQKIA